MKGLRTTLALGAMLASATALGACGNGVPSNAVARVGDATISKASFDHWLTIASNSSSASAPGQAHAPVPDPPNFTNCVAYLQKTAPKPAKGTTTPTTAQLKSQCQLQFGALRDQVMQLLITADWLQGEAADQGVKASDKDVANAFAQLKRTQFPTPAAFQRFLSTSGYTMQDVLFRVRINVLTDKIRQKVIGSKSKPTQAQIADYYNKNKTRFGQPERRDLRLILTKTEAQANQGKAAINSGQNFKTVAKRFSIDQASKAQGGALTGVTKGTQEQALDAAVFSAPIGKLLGPIKTPFGFYIFRVQKITAGSQQSLKDASPSIAQILVAQNQQKTLSNFVKTFNKKWKSRTNCRSGFVIANCSNAPKAKSGAGAGSTAPPPQGSPSGP